MNRLKELRKEKKLTQQELADMIGTTKLTVSNWENDKHVIKSDKAKKLADFFGVSVGYLLGYESDRELRNALAHGVAKHSDDKLLELLNEKIEFESFNIEKYNKAKTELIEHIDKMLLELRFHDLVKISGYVSKFLQEEQD